MKIIGTVCLGLGQVDLLLRDLTEVFVGAKNVLHLHRHDVYLNGKCYCM